MLSLLRLWQQPQALPCPFHRFITTEGSIVLIRRDAVDALRVVDHPSSPSGKITLIYAGGGCFGVVNSIENVLESVWDREGARA